MAEVKVNQTIKQEDLTCIICYEDIQLPLLQCANSLHFTCSSCLKKSRNKCSMCKGKVFNNKLLEQQLREQMYKCLNSGCKQYLFNWSIDEHRHECIFTEEECPICHQPTSLGLLKLHLKQDCPSISWINFGEVDSLNNDDLMEAVKVVGSKFYVDFNELEPKTPTAIFFVEFVIILVPTVTSWQIRIICIDPEEEKPIEIVCEVPVESELYSEWKKISLKSTNNLHIQETPSIPLNTKITEFNFGEEEMDTETFFQNLLRDRRREIDSDED